MKALGLLSLLATCVLAGCQAPLPQNAEPSSYVYHLAVTFPSGAAIHAVAAPGAAFSGTVTEKDGSAYAIGGEVLAAQGVSVPILLTIVETKLEAGQSSIVAYTAKTTVPLDKPTAINNPPICTVLVDP
jgi:hypothetical protein